MLFLYPRLKSACGRKNDGATEEDPFTTAKLPKPNARKGRRAAESGRESEWESVDDREVIGRGAGPTGRRRRSSAVTDASSDDFIGYSEM
jgi:hypothetical protein